MTLRNRDKVIERGFNFLHVTDQQAFNPEEMETWRVSAEYIDGDRHNHDYEWVMNTGDQTQNGNRIGEWIDYFSCGGRVLDNREQMFVVGNNDLSPADPEELGTGSDASKINSFNISLFYTFEHPDTIPRTPTKGIYIPNVYSFIYGDTYFLAMNSEISERTATDVFKEPLSTNIYTQVILPWVQADHNKYADSKIKWKVSFNHESPFTIITADLIRSYAGTSRSSVTGPNMGVSRGGSRTNTVGNQ